MLKHIKNIFLIFMVTFLLTGAAYSKTLKFIQVTDSHYASNGIDSENGTRDIAESEQILKSAVTDINSIKNVDFVIFTGDNIDKPRKDDLIKFLKIANGLNVPYYVVIGNHEVFKSQDFTKKDYMTTVNKYSKNCRERKPNYVFEKDGLAFVVVDGAKEIIPGANGYFKKDTLKWLDKTLTKYKNKKVVIFQHFPIVAPSVFKSHTTYDIKDYEAVLNKHNNVIAIFSGHYHENGENMKNGVYHVSSPALIVAPHDYKVVEIDLRDRNHPQIFTQLRHAE